MRVVNLVSGVGFVATYLYGVIDGYVGSGSSAPARGPRGADRQRAARSSSSADY